jgi:hypothetical protein
VAHREAAVSLTAVKGFFLRRQFADGAIRGVATKGALSASDELASLLRPGGELLGSPGIRPGIRTLSSRQALDDLFEQLSARGVPTNSKYPGTGFDLPDGGFVGLRESARYGPTIDINIPGFEVFKYHLGG